jgi:tetratricopeptide (TPR) repeat protein
MDREGRTDEAEFFYRRTLDLLAGAEVMPAYFSRLYNLYLREKKEDRALEVLRLGISCLPDHAPFRVQLGDYYLSRGIYYRAEQEYSQALRLDPENISLRRKLSDMARDRPLLN